MLEYILKRVLFFIPTLFIISLLTFTLSVNSPGDPVEMLMTSSAGENNSADKIAKKEEYEKLRVKLHLNLPVFYFTIGSCAEPDTLYKIPEKLKRENLSRLIDQYGNWTFIEDYFMELNAFNDYLLHFNLMDSMQDKLIETKQKSADLLYKYEDDEITSLLSQIENNLSSLALPDGTKFFQKVKSKYTSLKANATPMLGYLPSLHFYGFQNQYHKWLLDLFVGDFGTSYHKKEPVLDLIASRVVPTFILSVLSILIAFAVSIPLGVSSAVHQGTKKEKTTTILLFFLYSLPSFWVATLLINYLTSPEYFDFFPTTGFSDFEEGAGAAEQLGNYLHHMILPLFCYTYASFAFISRQMRGSMLQTLRQDYIRTAWAKGLAPKQVYWKHAIRNSLLPIITLVASIFPSLIAGSVVIEYLFTLPGMGRLAYEAEVSKDYPVIYIVMLFSAALTLVGYLVADILYAMVDPRISYGKK